MTYFRDSILATLVYYDTLDFPLTMFEVYKYLINPARLDKNAKSSVFKIEASDIAVELDNMAKAELIRHKNGFYFLQDRDFLYELRIEKEKIAAQKWKKFLRIAKWFQAVPYLRAILASGSLAINNTVHESDFDVLAVVKDGRLYTARIFLSLAASFFGARRTRYDKSAPDKFCFNHYITDGNMNIRHESLYNAQTYANLKPVLARNGALSKFYNENMWLNEYIYGFKPAEEFVLRKVSSNPALLGIGGLGEFILNSPLGNKLESWAKRYQQKRIKENPMTHESGGRVVFNDNELEFHPRSFESFAVST